MKPGFNHEKYIDLQSSKIKERIAKFDDKLYLEFGGKLFDDYHASRVLPGFKPDSKLSMLLSMKDQAEIVIVVNAQDIEANKIRSDLNIPYDEDVLRLIKEFTNIGLKVGSVVITRYARSPRVSTLERKLKARKIPVFHHYFIEGYPTDTTKILSSQGFGKNDYIETTQPLVVVTAPGPGSGKMAVCLSQLYHEAKRGTQAGYAKYETFPIWSLPISHPINMAYEAATVDLADKNMIDSYHMEAYGELATSYNRDLEIFPVLKHIFESIHKEPIYKSPTDMGVNMAGFCIEEDETCQEASKQEIIRRYFESRSRFYDEKCEEEELNKQRMIMKALNLQEEDRKVVAAARKKEQLRKVSCGAMEMEDGTIITSSTTSFLGSAAGLILNALKHLAGIEDEVLLISPEMMKPIQSLKTKNFGSINPRLHIDETLIALAIASLSNENAKRAMDQLGNLEGLQAHITSNLSETDLESFKTLGIQTTYESDKK